MLESMGRPTGRADLPLHGGRVPAWLRTRMEALGRVVCEAIVLEYGRDELLRRLAHPFWFQSFGAVMGMDWHSSGITTSVMGALKRGLEPVAGELGVHVCGGRGRHSRRTPDELRAVGERVGIDGDALARTSRLVAKVDSAAVQDGFELYLHGFVVTDDGHWVVVQQGMDTTKRQARRYHWLSEGIDDFVDAPHAAIDGPNHGRQIINLTDRRARASKQAQLELVCSAPDTVLAVARRLREDPEPLFEAAAPVPRLTMPAHHDVRPSDVVMRRLRGTLAAAADAGPKDFAELLLQEGIGARTIETLALVSEVVYGAPSRFTDPARYSMALGGKDGHPFPVPVDVYDATIRVLRKAVDRARLNQDDRLAAIRRLDIQARALESGANGPDFYRFIAEEKRLSAARGGRTVAGPVGPAAPPARPRVRRPRRRPARGQLGLPGMED
jgi:hypothetical protein